MSSLPPDTDRFQVLLVHARERLCALRLSNLVETMRPQPIATIPGAPAYVLGMAMIRAIATPVIDLGAALEETGPACLTRFLTLKSGGRSIALAVDRLIGVQVLSANTLRPLPSQLQRGSAQRIEAMGSLNDQLLFLIEPSQLVPEQLWARGAA